MNHCSTRWILLLVSIELTFNGATGNEISREKRHLLLTEDSATGILAAIAIPLEKEKPHGVDIFCSYNFEMNYGMTTEASDWTDPWKRFRVKETENGLAESGGEGGGEGRRRKRSASELRRPTTARGITRRKVYHVIEEQLRVAGFDGRKCLLRAICEAGGANFYENNGVLGDLMQILLTPSYSMVENLPKEFYKAETLGMQNNCTKYERRCPTNVLNLFSLEIKL